MRRHHTGRTIATNVAVPLAAAALILAACDGDDTATGGSTSTTTDTTETTETTDTTGTTDPGSLPGEQVDIYPYEGARLAVVGVAADDTLNVRSGPGVGYDVVLELEPLATDVTATGHNRSLGGAGFWSEITVDDVTGWANSTFLLQPGQVRDITAELFPTPADRPSAADMVELGETVAGLRASADPPSTVVVVDGPTVGDLGEITVDVIGLGDDSVGGERLTIFAEPAPGDSFTVRSVEAMDLCSRGVGDDGICA